MLLCKPFTTFLCRKHLTLLSIKLFSEFVQKDIIFVVLGNEIPHVRSLFNIIVPML